MTVLAQPMSFSARPGWLWGGGGIQWVLSRDNGSTWLGTSLYGGAVVPAYCEDPPPTIPMPKASDIVAWLGTVKGLKVVVTTRTVGGYPVWQLDMTTGVIPSCSGDPGKGGLVSLWNVLGEEAFLPQTMGDHEQQRVYLAELPSHIVIVTAHTTREEGVITLTYAEFLKLADEIVASLQFD